MFGGHFAQNMFIAEQEGLTMSRREKIDAVIDEIERNHIHTVSEVNKLLEKYKLSKLDQQELIKIIKAAGLR